MCENHTPQIDGQWVTFVFRTDTCPVCKANMIESSQWNYSPFVAGENSFTEQVKRSGLVLRSDVMVENEFICVNCKRDGKADFYCYLCQRRKESCKMKESYGDPAEFLCTDCFSRVSAKVWDNAESELSHKHKNDFS